jgi:hypothetical protein
MIRTVVLSALLIAAAGAADAATVKVSLAGKTDATVKVELVKAARTVCADAPVMEYFACVQETYQKAVADMAKVRGVRNAGL